MIRKPFIFICILIFVVPAFALGQPGDPGGGGTPGAVPISGIEWLIGGGILIGMKSLFMKRKRHS